jgi:hypothetical protein
MLCASGTVYWSSIAPVSRAEELRDPEVGAALELTEHNLMVGLHRGRAMARGLALCIRGANAKRLSLDLERRP